MKSGGGGGSSGPEVPGAGSSLWRAAHTRSSELQKTPSPCPPGRKQRPVARGRCTPSSRVTPAVRVTVRGPARSLHTEGPFPCVSWWGRPTVLPGSMFSPADGHLSIANTCLDRPPLSAGKCLYGSIRYILILGDTDRFGRSRNWRSNHMIFHLGCIQQR